MRRFATKSLVAIPLAGVLLVSGCSGKQGPSDSLQVVANPVAAVAAVSPVAAKKPVGQVLAEPSSVTAVANDPSTRTLAVALTNPPSLRLYSLDDLTAAPRTVALAGPVEHLSVSPGQFLASVPTKSQIAKITALAGHVTELPIKGIPSAAITVGAQTYVAVRDRKEIDVLDGDKVTKTIGGQLYSADDILTAGDTTIVLDRLRTAVFRVDVAGGTVAEGLRAGDGATNAVADSYGRVLVTDSRDSSLLAFSADPLLMRQRYPVPGGAYGIAYDAQRNLAWVTLTSSNEVVGFDVRGGEPVEKYRFATVRQPNSVTVDQQTGHVIVGSAAGEGTQVISP
ncbi:MAG: hypothetical protein JWQ81_1040 [Amycolatopsis sp.]|uniref:YncE family protein n=1 Tax=Amycolatopsis sp. TaxID=37632 RepID=UPI00260C8583|nr:hypothetical protein [Amycolatopsis sp.]MCU1680301.1 hypothetical protein [Amycolatopsis sp.]